MFDVMPNPISEEELNDAFSKMSTELNPLKQTAGTPLENYFKPVVNIPEGASMMLFSRDPNRLTSFDEQIEEWLKENPTYTIVGHFGLRHSDKPYSDYWDEQYFIFFKEDK